MPFEPQGLSDAAEWVQSGKLGAIKYAVGTCYKARPTIGKSDKPLEFPSYVDHDLWVGPAADEPIYRPEKNSQGKYNPHYDWHWDYNTGNGDLGNQGIHQMDIARWFLGEPALAPRVMSIGGRLGYEDAGNTANTQIVFHDYAKAPLIFEVRGLKTKRLPRLGRRRRRAVREGVRRGPQLHQLHGLRQRRQGDQGVERRRQPPRKLAGSHLGPRPQDPARRSAHGARVERAVPHGQHFVPLGQEDGHEGHRRGDRPTTSSTPTASTGCATT